MQQQQSRHHTLTGIAWKRLMGAPARHSTAPPLAVAVTARLALGRATATTDSLPGICSTCCCVLRARSHTRAVPSLLPVMAMVSSTLMQVTGPEWPLMVAEMVNWPLHHLSAAALCYTIGGNRSTLNQEVHKLC